MSCHWLGVAEQGVVVTTDRDKVEGSVYSGTQTSATKGA